MMDKILALGAENKNTFTVIMGDHIYVSKPVETLTGIENYNRFEKTTRDHLAEEGIVPNRIACDLHPDYLSTSLAELLGRENKDSVLVKVQHHHAHIVSCMEDNGINEKVIGVSFDGTGYGSDGASWGGEFFICDRKQFERKYHLGYVPVPGGDAAVTEIWRMALAYLYQAYGDAFRETDIPLLHRIESNKIDMVEQMIKKNVNCPLSSGMGRLFDAVAALVGICDIAEYEAQGAIMLEQIADKNTGESYKYSVTNNEADVAGLIKGIVEDIKEGIDPGVISAKFHNTVCDKVFRISELLHQITGIRKVCISGGCFQNQYLVDLLEEMFSDSAMELFKHKKYSTTDLGISVGQAVIAANA
ncbi:MAG: hypothetical protein P9L90_03985 [Candidatus Aadella gelida]|nr:hypothetical protein [Candidatus Aadella gelida]